MPVGRRRHSLVRLSILALVFALALPANAQTKVPKKALALFNKAYYDIGLNRFETAKTYLEDAIDIYPAYAEARIYLADIYFHTGQYEEAIAAYTWVAAQPAPPWRVFHFLARSYFATGRFDETVATAEKYLANPKLSENTQRDARLLIANAHFSKTEMANPVPFNAENLGEKVNTADSEYLPSLNADETTVIFTRLLGGQEDLYATGKDRNGQWRLAEALEEGTINTGHNEGAHCISADGNTLLFTICNERNTRGSCDLYLSNKDGNGWTSPRNMGPAINSVSWDSQPSLSADGLTIYFVSNRPGGYGGKDLWVTHWKNGTWTAPENLGPEINTPYDEQTPFIHFDNETLYFSSDGHPGLGLHDIFISRRQDGKWSGPLNLGYPVNTNQVESGLTVSLDGSRAYYAAERDEGFGKLDIYEFKVPEHARPGRVTYVRARIIDKSTGKPVDADFALNYLSVNRDALTGTAVDGEFLICLPSGQDYGLQVKEEGYTMESMNFALKDTVERKAYVVTVEIEPIAQGQTMVLRNVFFITDSYDLLPASFSELQELVALLQRHPERTVEISGHTDNTGASDYNLDLSRRRAESVVQFLVLHGVTPQRLVARGYGDTRPMAGNDTAEGRALNRRTEVKILN